MHGSSLVTTEEIVCLAVDPDDSVIKEIRSWALDRGLAFQVIGFGDSLTYAPEETLGVAVGGDGTFLEAVRAFSPHGVPIAGVSRGTLSFLSRIPPAGVTDALDEIMRGEAAVAKRQQFRIEGPDGEALGVNDVTVEPVQEVGMPSTCRLQAFVDDEFVGSYEGGGMAVATPTGSTAMSLSAGGPILHPRGNQTLELFDLHNGELGSHPLVVDAQRQVSLKPETKVRILVDGGRTVWLVPAGETLRVTGAGPAFVVRTSLENSFMATLATKLNWTIRDADPPPLTEPSDGVTRSLRQKGVPATTGDADHSLHGDAAEHEGWIDDPARIWAELRSESPPRVGTWDERPARPTRDERPAWLQDRDVPTGKPSDDLIAAARRIACEAAVAAGQFAHRHFERLGASERPEHRHVVEAAEDGSQAVLEAILGNAFPDHSMRSEGTVVRDHDSDYTWLLDPIDGVDNFEHGNPSYCTTVALLSGETPVVGVVFAPAAQELFHAIRGGDAYRNDGRIRPTDRASLDESMLLSGYDPDGDFLQQFYQHTRGVRRLGSQALSLSYVAAGSADALWEYDTTPWDVAAGLCLLRAAGGRVTDPAGSAYGIDFSRDQRTPLLASNGPLHPTLLDLLEETNPG
jgi:myo-inositol-1(or 4)-monophosphatase